MKFKTFSGSTYEVDPNKKLIRRVSNTNGVAPTNRIGNDNEWRSYAMLVPTPISIGEQVMIYYSNECELLPETKDELEQEGGCAFPATITSYVVSIDNSPVALPN